MSRTRKLAAATAIAAVLGGSGLSIAQAENSGSQRTQDRPASAQSDRGGKPRGGKLTQAQLAAIAKKIGVTSAQLKAALDANRPSKPDGARGDRGAQFAADIATALGVDEAEVKEILDANRPPRPANRPAKGSKPPARPDQSKLVSALASGLGIEQSTVKTALDTLAAEHRAEHESRRDAMHAAIAKTLGVDTSTVADAFAAVLPAPPARG
jgi:hypothetical protein